MKLITLTFLVEVVPGQGFIDRIGVCISNSLNLNKYFIIQTRVSGNHVKTKSY